MWYAQVRPSSVPKYPQLELDRWYPIREQDDFGCFIRVGDTEVFLKRGHYVFRHGRRRADRSARVPARHSEAAAPAVIE